MIVMEEIQGVVREAARLFADRAAAGKIREKGAYDYVTAVDEAMQHFLQKKLGKPRLFTASPQKRLKSA